MATAGSTWYQKSLESDYAYDPAKARKLLAEAGYPHGFTVTMPDVSSVAPSQQVVMARDPYTRRLMLAAPVPDPERQRARRERRRSLMTTAAE
ncbi:hypothetical protein [Streptomyces rugosispiralis]|uniref:Solute-binding protein family 5 domain-containing protein n=1 Tax=Streptomyces rugosispiralis TaxID=2967341 RepID=A0ABT1V1H2_9ACTN|nr:hypothetical protein [Streptomyces rugosispiralis]MCQ8191239.1 hypothetical protein [Streptomyces rugosispiralis]